MGFSFMRLSNAEKLQMVLEHLEEGIPPHMLAAKYQYHLSNIKHFFLLYRLYGKGALSLVVSTFNTTGNLN